MQAAEQSNSLEPPNGRDLDAVLRRIDQFAGEYQVYTHPALYQTASGINLYSGFAAKEQRSSRSKMHQAAKGIRRRSQRRGSKEPEGRRAFERIDGQILRT